MGVSVDEGGDEARFGWVVDVLGEELIDEAPEHDVADKIEVEDPGIGHGEVVVAIAFS